MNKLWLEEAWENYLEWHVSDIRAWMKINDLVREIERTPFKGIGRPHPLKRDRRGYWNRGITRMDRLVYRVESNTITIADCRGHYE